MWAEKNEWKKLLAEQESRFTARATLFEKSIARISHQVSSRNGEDACRYKAREVRAT